MRALICLLLLAGAARGEMLLTTISSVVEDVAGNEAILDLPPTAFWVTDDSLNEFAHFPIEEVVIGATLRVDEGPVMEILNDVLHFATGDRTISFRIVGNDINSVRNVHVVDLWSDGLKHNLITSWPYTVDADYTPPNGMNLTGTPHELSAIEVVIDSYESFPSSFNPDFLMYDIGFTVRLFSSVPEPSTQLLACCLMAWCRPCRRVGCRRS